MKRFMKRCAIALTALTVATIAVALRLMRLPILTNSDKEIGTKVPSRSMSGGGKTENRMRS